MPWGQQTFHDANTSGLKLAVRGNRDQWAGKDSYDFFAQMASEESMAFEPIANNTIDTETFNTWLENPASLPPYLGQVNKLRKDACNGISPNPFLVMTEPTDRGYESDWVLLTPRFANTFAGCLATRVNREACDEVFSATPTPSQ